MWVLWRALVVHLRHLERGALGRSYDKKRVVVAALLSLLPAELDEVVVRDEGVLGVLFVVQELRAHLVLQLRYPLIDALLLAL